MAGVEMLLYMSLLPDGCNTDYYYLMAGVEMLLYMSLLPDGCNRDHYYLMVVIEIPLPDGWCRDLVIHVTITCCLLYTSPSPRDLSTSRMPSSA